MIRHLPIALLAALLAAGCATTGKQDGPEPGYVDPAEADASGGVGIDSSDIVAMTDRMARDLLATPQLMNWDRPPRIVIDAKYFRNEGSSRVNRSMITDRLRVELARAAAGKLVFLGRHYSDMVEEERDLEEGGVVTGGTQGETDKSLGWDYRLGGRIATLDKVVPETGDRERYHQITFELVERGSGTIAWSNMYEFEKLDQVDAVYR